MFLVTHCMKLQSFIWTQVLFVKSCNLFPFGILLAIWKFFREITEVGPYFWTFLHFFLRETIDVQSISYWYFSVSWKFLPEITEVSPLFLDFYTSLCTIV